METYTWTLYNNWFSTSFKSVEGEESFIDSVNLNWAKVWDNVEVINLSDNPNLPILKVQKIIESTKTKVEWIVVEWIYRQTNKNYGFVDTPWKKKWYFVKNSNTSWARTWDKVKAVVRSISWKDEAYIQEIVSSQKKQFKQIKEFLWDDYEAKSDVMKIALEQWARIAFSQDLLDEVSKIDSWIDINEINKRVDHRELFTITIDWPDSKDLDDAISIIATDDWYKLFVHIADVSHYVKEWSLLDDEAMERATSIYFTDRVIPMLPEKLSNDLCSLNPHTDKLTMTYEISVRSDWSIDYDNSSIYESIINSNYRMTYEEMVKLRDWNIELNWALSFGWVVTNDLLKITSFWSKLANSLNRNTKSEGELEFDFPETKVDVDKNGKAIGFKAYPKYDSNDWIKAFMVAANDLSSYKMWENPYIYRTHLKPKEESIEKLQNILAIIGVKFDISDASSETFVKLLEYIKWHEKEKFLSKAILVTMQKATYTHEKQWHFWLAKDDYTHSTSPIRRYSDLIAHRITKDYLNWELVWDRLTHYNNMLQLIAEKCSAEEDKAEKIEAEVNKYKSCEYMEDKIWTEFIWYISSITERWIYVQLDNTIEWVLDIARDDWLYFSKLCEWLYEVTDMDNNTSFNVWDDIEVKVKKVDKENRKIYFDFI